MRSARPLWLRFLLAERGVLLWMPGLWAAAALVLFAIVQASAQRTFFNHAQALSVAVGPLDLESAAPGDGQAFTEALRQGLSAQRELNLVGDDAIRRRVATLLGTPLPEDPLRWMRATRNLNVSVYLTARLWRAESLLHASVTLWSVGEEEEFARFSAWDEATGALAQALADSVGRALFTPRGALQASR